jgi:hypothetical protein
MNVRTKCRYLLTCRQIGSRADLCLVFEREPSVISETAILSDVLVADAVSAR